MKSVLQVFSFNIVSKIMMGMTGILLIRYMSLGEYARFTLAFSMMTVVTQALTVSFNRIYIVGQRGLGLRNSSSPFLGFQLLGIVLLAFLAYPWFGHSTGLYLFTIAATIATCFSEFTKTFFQEKMKFVNYSFVEISRTLLITLGIIAIIFLLKNNIAAWQVLSVQAAAMGLIFLVVFARRLDLKGLVQIGQVIRLGRSIVKGNYRYLFGYFLLLSFFGQLDVFMLRYLSDDATVATYGSAFRYYTMVIMALSSAHAVLLPMTQKAENVDELKNIFRKFTKLVLIFAPAVLLGAWASQWIIPAIDTGKYPQAITVFRILAVSAIFSFALSPHVNLVMRYEKFRFLFINVIIAALASVGLNFLLVPYWGAIGTAISTLISFAYVNSTTYLMAKHLLRNNTVPPGEPNQKESDLPLKTDMSEKTSSKYGLGSLRPYAIKFRTRVREYFRKLRRPVRVVELDKFFVKYWRGEAPTSSYFTSRKTNRFFFGYSDKATYAKALKRHFPKSSKEIIDRAQSVLEHKFDLLGSGETCLGQVIDWHTDFKCGKTWPREHFTKIRIVDPSDTSDIKVPWELSRLQHITDLGRAYWLTGDSSYKNEFKSQITEWEEANPVDIGANWSCSMEAAIRGINILWGMHLFAFDDNEQDFIRRSVRLLYYHGLHIEKNLEKSAAGANSNHLISDYLGLFFIGLLIPEMRRAKHWMKLGLSGLENEIKAQVLPDGADYECSTSYHRLALEMFLSAYLLGNKNNIVFSDDYKARLEAMIEFSAAITAQSGLTPLMGDNDDGLIIKLSTDNPADHGALIDIGHIAFNKRSSSAIPGAEERLWYLGADSLAVMNDSESTGSHLFEASGYAVIRDGGFHLLFNAAGVPKRNFGGHKHNDLLSFTLEIDGVPYLIDPGTFCYSADFEMRNLSRSAGRHNTVVVDDAEQNRFLPGKLFFLLPDSNPKVNLWTKTDKSVVVSASHDGYERLGGIIHRRTITAWPASCQLHLRDDFDGERGRTHKFSMQFITPLLDIRKIDPASLEIRAGHAQGLYIRASEEGLDSLDVTPIDYFPRYGVKAPAYLIRFNYLTSPPFGFSASIGLMKHERVALPKFDEIEVMA